MRWLQVLLLSCIVLIGCNKASSEFVEVSFKVVIPENTQSEMIRVSLFDIGTGAVRGGFFMSSYIQESGTRVFSQTESIRAGQYTAVAYNMDAAGVEVRGEASLPSFEFVTRASSDTTVMTPGELAVAKLSPISALKDGSVELSCELVTTYSTIRVGVDGLQYASGKSGCVRGLGSSYFPDSGKAAATEMLSFEMNVASPDALSATICSFGELGPKYDFTFRITTSGGAYKYFATTDSKFQFPGSIIVPASASDSGSGKDGFAPQIGQWNDYSVIVPL